MGAGKRREIGYHGDQIARLLCLRLGRVRHDPAYERNMWVTQAEAKALGLLGSSIALDGYIGFAAGNKFAYSHGHGVPSGLYDFFGVVAHEISEVMGRTLLVGSTVASIPNGNSLLDFFHYSSALNRDFVGTQPGYFSIDGGVTHLANFNTNPSGDFGDWAAGAGTDAFRAFAPWGRVNNVSTTDLRELDVLGWDLSNNSPSAAAHNAKAHHVHRHPRHHKAVTSHATASAAESDQFISRHQDSGAPTNFSRSEDVKTHAAAHAIWAGLAPRHAASDVDHIDSFASHTGSPHFSTDHVLFSAPPVAVGDFLIV